MWGVMLFAIISGRPPFIIQYLCKAGVRLELGGPLREAGPALPLLVPSSLAASLPPHSRGVGRGVPWL